MGMKNPAQVFNPSVLVFAGELGFEPRQADPEAGLGKLHVPQNLHTCRSDAVLTQAAGLASESSR